MSDMMDGAFPIFRAHRAEAVEADRIGLEVVLGRVLFSATLASHGRYLHAL